MFTGIARKWSDSSLGTKLLVCYILVLLLPLGLLGGYFFTVLQRSIYEQSQFIYEANLRQLQESVSRKAGNARRLAELYVNNAQIRSVFGNEYASESLRVVEYQMRTEGFAKSLLSLNPEFNAVYVYNDDLVLCEMMRSFTSIRREESPQAFKALSPVELRGPQGWTFYRSDLRNLLRPELSPQLMATYRLAIVDHRGNRVAMMEVAIDAEELFADLEATEGEYAQTYAVDGNGTILTKPGGLLGQSIARAGFQGFDSGQYKNARVGSAIQIALPVPELGVSLVSLVPMRPLRGVEKDSVIFAAAMMLLALVLCSALFYLLIRKMLSGVPRMLKAMEEIRGGNFKTRLPDTRHDELGVLARDFNYMSERLEEQVKRVYELGQLEKEAEFRAMESNMNPHFLYNSLATISWIARAHGANEIVDATQALAQFYRIVLSKGKSVITLSEEVDMVKAYAKIQKIRYEDRFEIHYDLSEEALRFPIIKNLLQPLVENAIEHGIQSKRGNGAVWITARVSAGRLDLQVRDDGAGMDEARRRDVLSGNTKDERGGYAVQNIMRRLGMYYETQYEFALHSTPGEGTVVQIVLPGPMGGLVGAELADRGGRALGTGGIDSVDPEARGRL